MIFLDLDVTSQSKSKTWRCLRSLNAFCSSAVLFFSTSAKMFHSSIFSFLQYFKKEVMVKFAKITEIVLQEPAAGQASAGVDILRVFKLIMSQPIATEHVV